MKYSLPPEDVQSYPRPPALQRVTQRVRVVLGGTDIVSTTDALRILETHHAPTYYVPRNIIDAELILAAGGSFCEWKGVARYWTISSGNTIAERCAWDYPTPVAQYSSLVGHLAIYAHAMDACYVGGLMVTPQLGNFYGGWTTPNLTGRIKGDLGTEGW